jgi:hypothetical protein
LWGTRKLCRKRSRDAIIPKTEAGIVAAVSWLLEGTQAAGNYAALR